MRRGKTGVTADREKIEFRLFNSSSIFSITLCEELPGKTGVTADRDKIEFRLFNSSSILSRSATPVFPGRSVSERRHTRKHERKHERKHGANGSRCERTWCALGKDTRQDMGRSVSAQRHERKRGASQSSEKRHNGRKDIVGEEKTSFEKKRLNRRRKDMI